MDQTTPVRVVLASQSPRRRELLTLVGIPHDVRPADLDESALPGEEALPHAERLARAKAEAIAAPGTLTVAADTIVVVDGAILGKPSDEADAHRMLRRLSGRSHVVVTAVAIAYDGRVVSGIEQVGVTFRDLDDAEIDAYIATREPMDKAGAYGIQGYGATIVDRVDGDYFAVMGLPLNRLVRLMADVGVRYEFGAPFAVERASR